MRVKNLISFYNIQRFFSIFYQTKYDKSLIDRKFSRFLYLLCKDTEKLVHFDSFWFILIHFDSFYKIPLFYHF